MKQKTVVPYAVFAFILATAFTASASPVSPGQHQCSGDLVLNTTYKIENSMDSGVAGNYWAYDFINRHIQVRQVSDDTFCAEVQDAGYFVTVEGISPGGTGFVSAGIKGKLDGGYVMTIMGTLDPQYDVFGNIGKFDYQCHPETGSCDSAFKWLASFFSNYTYSYQQWGWTYHTGKNGMWINSSDGNSGDITD